VGSPVTAVPKPRLGWDAIIATTTANTWMQCRTVFISNSFSEVLRARSLGIRVAPYKVAILSVFQTQNKFLK